jgi:hypothetical protein
VKDFIASGIDALFLLFVPGFVYVSTLYTTETCRIKQSRRAVVKKTKRSKLIVESNIFNKVFASLASATEFSMQLHIIIILLVSLTLAFGAATPCTISADGLSLKCQQLSTSADLGDLDVSEVSQILIRGNGINWGLAAARLPSLTSAYCALSTVECVGRTPAIQTDCVCSTSTQLPPRGDTGSVLLGSILGHLERVLPSSTVVKDSVTTLDPEQCPAIYRQGVSQFLAGIPNSACLSAFLEGWQGILVLLLAVLIGGSCTVFSGSVALWHIFRLLLRVSNYPILCEIFFRKFFFLFIYIPSALHSNTPTNSQRPSSS